MKKTIKFSINKNESPIFGKGNYSRTYNSDVLKKNLSSPILIIDNSKPSFLKSNK